MLKAVTIYKKKDRCFSFQTLFSKIYFLFFFKNTGLQERASRTRLSQPLFLCLY